MFKVFCEVGNVWERENLCMVCPKCGKNVEDNYKFCKYCGNSLKKPVCRKKNRSIKILAVILMLFSVTAAIYICIIKQNEKNSAIEIVYDTENDIKNTVAEEESSSVYIDALNEGDTSSIVKSGSWGDNFTWKLSEKGTLTISGSGEMEDGGRMGSETPWHDFRSDIKILIIEEGITDVDSYAFYYCQNLVSVKFPSTLERIESCAFSECSSLIDITLEDVEIEGSAFKGCSALQSVSISGKSSIGVCAFQYCLNLKNVSISDEIDYIGASAFLYTAFYDDEANWDESVLYINNWLVKANDSVSGNYKVKEGTIGIAQEAFEYTDITGIVLPESLIYIESYSFRECQKLLHLEIPKSVTIVDACAFTNCDSLIDVVVLAENDCVIGDYVFRDCDSLSSVIIKEGTISIGSYALAGCDNLTYVYLPVSLSEISSYVFSECESLAEIYYAGDYSSWKRIPYTEYINIRSDSDIDIYCNSTEPSISDSLTEFAIDEINVENTTEKTEEMENEISILESKIGNDDSEKTFSTVASGECGKYLIWELNSAGTLTISGHGSMSSWSNTGDTPWNDYRASIITAVVEEGVTSLGSLAFWYCENMTKIELPSTLTQIGDSVFYHCSSLQSIVIPASVTEIDYLSGTSSVFGACNSLERIDVEEGNTEYISEEGVLFTKDMTTLFQCPGGKAGVYIVPESVKVIRAYAFEECENLTDIVMQEGVEIIEKSAFSNCSALTSITLPESIITIYNSFDNCINLTDVYYSGSKNDWLYIMMENDSNEELLDSEIHFEKKLENGETSELDSSIVDAGTYGENIKWTLNDEGVLILSGTGDMPDGEDNSNWAWIFVNSNQVFSIIIRDGITRIGSYAFSGLNYVTNVEIADSVTSIGEGAFSNCSSITEISIPDNVTVIERLAFSYCSCLKIIELSDQLVEIGDQAFMKCSNLESISLPDSIASIGIRAFTSCSSLVEIVMPGGVTTIQEYTFYECSGLRSVTLSEGITTIENIAFYGCNNIVELSLPTSLNSVGNQNFTKCENLTEVDYAGTSEQWENIEINGFGNTYLENAIINYLS